ncbi:Histidine kinase [Flagellimonas taeanensis]|uniref:Histidine kinase n=2 Tax=Flagellimonas taeanensis TaxID=1005926 RepID=A0A1M6YQ93_9FLAO|nr:Histidine kinase [Allomuricauda taeanensis]SHL20436.1 Histidine kinase [Allomuricauda taeanensis]
MKNKRRNVFLHVMVWSVLFFFPFILSYNTEQAFRHVVAFSWVPLMLYMLVFYLNYLFLADRFFFSKRMLLFIGINILIIGILIWLRELGMDRFFPRPLNGEVGKGPPRKMVLYIQTLSFLVPIAWAVGQRAMERLIRTENERREAAHQQLKSDLQHLQYQLQPHFFFNSLNNIYALVDISPEDAKSTIHSLGKMMRYLLYDTHTEKVPLAKEIGFMIKYIELGKLRLSEKTQVDYNFPEVEPSVMVPPLLFISLIENALKHGVSAHEESSIFFHMELNNDQRIIFKGRNTDFPKTDSDKSGSGIGMKNLKDRLELLYPNDYFFHTETKSGIFHVIMEIPLHP